MNGTSRGLLVAAVLLLPTLGMAQESAKPTKPQFSYSYVELGYDKADFDVKNLSDTVHGDDLTLSGSFELKDNWHVYGSYGAANLDGGIDLDTGAIGLGYSHPLGKDVDLYGRVLYLDTRADFGQVSAGDDGLGFQFRVRGRVNEKIEVEGGLQYIDVSHSHTSLQASARYYFTRAFSAGVGITFGGDVDGVGINARFNF